MDASKKKYAVPPGKRVLNTHISVAEHEHLKRMAKANAMTVTMYLRNMIRSNMKRTELDVRVAMPELWPGGAPK